MAEPILEKATCGNCGADVRENTQFCYSCGKRFTEVSTEINGPELEAMSGEARTALDDLAAKLRTDDAESEDKLALAAANRKKARVAPKRREKIVWETEDTSSGVFIFIVSVFIFVLAAAAVFVTVYWK